MADREGDPQLRPGGALGLRPVFHYREDRIRAHVQLCWLALLLLRVVDSVISRTMVR